MIHEIGLSSNKSLFDLTPGFQRLESLYACLQATKSWFDLFFSLSPTLYPSLPIQVLAQMSHAIVTSYRIATFEHPDWDLEMARQTVNPSIILNQIVENFSQVKDLASLDCGGNSIGDTFSEVSKRITSVKAWWDSKFGQRQAPIGVGFLVFDEVAAMNQSMAFWEERWLTGESPGAWNYQSVGYQI
jgi:hypothetical protein